MGFVHIVIGGGAYGCFVAARLAAAAGKGRVLLIERESGLLRRASYANQARVHGGYHYPRSLLTGLRSRANVARFLAEFGDTVDDRFEHYYAIARRLSNVTPDQFTQFCRRIGAPLSKVPPAIRSLFDDDMVEAVFRVEEFAFDAVKLRTRLEERLVDTGVVVALATEALRVGLDGAGSGIRVETRHRITGERCSHSARTLYNCTYACLNGVLAAGGLATIRLRHEATEIALVQPPPALARIGITVMCGPFFSLMPFPAEGLASLSHVRYTPHYEWAEEPGAVGPPHQPSFPLPSNFDRMRRDAQRYVPAMAACRYVRSLWEVKTILPQSGANDSRPILFKRDPVLPGVVSLLGGKIDNMFDLEDVLPRPGDAALPGAEGVGAA